MRPKIITICGSMKFFDDMLKIASELTSKGIIVLMPFCVKSDNGKMLNKLHREKIQLSDEILVVSRDNYIGESTRNEIKYASKLYRKVTFINDR